MDPTVSLQWSPYQASVVRNAPLNSQILRACHHYTATVDLLMVEAASLNPSGLYCAFLTKTFVRKVFAKDLVNATYHPVKVKNVTLARDPLQAWTTDTTPKETPEPTPKARGNASGNARERQR